MKVHITNVSGLAGAAGNAQQRVTDIARRYLYVNVLGIFHYPVESDTPEMLRTRLDGILAAISHGDTVIFQLPTWNDIKFDEAFAARLGNYRGVKKIFFVHDVPPLMFENTLGWLGRYIDLYNLADVLIVPSREMEEYLRSNGLKVPKIVVQRMWDFPVEIDQTIVPCFRKRINFAANVTSNYRPFVREWNHDRVELAVTANPGDYEWAKGRNIRFLGWHNNDNLLADALRKSGGFGLLWQDCPWWKEYMKLNASYKRSACLAAGLPIIVSSSTAETEMILRKNLGLVVDSLDEAVDRVASMEEGQYRKMVEDVGKFAQLIQGGYFTKKLLIDSVFRLLYD
ncbi:MAG: sugar transferase [Lachnospiraceae bacterium]|jgi:glycosyltransferase involved in cell wall biosynthesis|uniref:Glucosyltransferase 3 n=1 Tax=Acetatifactor muris TaxID=879566 RepID=A0A2K4ZEP1_9FIRM|nr:sugar transferase [Acetatifactor muris]MCI8287452.1 sugar transferase [Lachnospiraceae bacterium]MCR2048540.1 sugar transferase [Acetatifactor muris]SOY28932.1 Beta-1,6-galactofuranosyltransferase WbbI [Acetatifactor muris]